MIKSSKDDDITKKKQKIHKHMQEKFYCEKPRMVDKDLVNVHVK